MSRDWEWKKVQSIGPVSHNLNDLCHERFVEWRVVPGHKIDSKAEKLAKQATDEYFNSAPYK